MSEAPKVDDDEELTLEEALERIEELQGEIGGLEDDVEAGFDEWKAAVREIRAIRAELRKRPVDLEYAILLIDRLIGPL